MKRRAYVLAVAARRKQINQRIQRLERRAEKSHSRTIKVDSYGNEL